MGCRNGVFVPVEEKVLPESLSDALLFTTMCIIDFPVDVHVRDGSIYSGIFHTACVDDGYAIVLKRAKMIKKGNREANITNGRSIETLIVLSEDLVQVVAKEVLLPAEGICGKAGADAFGSMTGIAPLDVCQESEANMTNANYSKAEQKGDNCTRLDRMKNDSLKDSVHENSLEVEIGKSAGTNLEKKEAFSIHSVNWRHVGDSSEQKHTDFREKLELQAEQTTNEVQGSISSFDAYESQPNSSDNRNEETMIEETEELFNGSSFQKSAFVKYEDCNEGQTAEVIQHSVVHTSNISTDVTSVMNAASELCLSSSSTSTKVVPPKNPYYNQTAKESKLNPRAKVFSPSGVLYRSATPPAVPTFTNLTYMPDPSPVTPIATAEPEVDVISSAYRSSAPAKLLSHNSLVCGNGLSDLHYAQTTAGNARGTTQPVRYAGQYNHLQPGPAFVHPNSQNVMAGRLGPLVYVHPVSNDVVSPSTGGFSQVPVRPLLTSHPINFPKHQGTATMQAMQLYLTPPFVTNGQQPFTMPSYIPISQPLFPVMGPIPVPGSESSFSTKFA